MVRITPHFISHIFIGHLEGVPQTDPEGTYDHHGDPPSSTHPKTNMEPQNGGLVQRSVPFQRGDFRVTLPKDWPNTSGKGWEDDVLIGFGCQVSFGEGYDLGGVPSLKLAY